MNDTSDSNAIDLENERKLRLELLAFGEGMIARGIEDQDLPDLLHRYSELFDRWFNSANLSSPDLIDSNLLAERSLALAPVLNNHNAILDFVSRAKDLTETELKTLRSKGRGILAYVDTLPKKVSLTKGQKG